MQDTKIANTQNAKQSTAQKVKQNKRGEGEGEEDQEQEEEGERDDLSGKLLVGLRRVGGHTESQSSNQSVSEAVH